MFDSRNQACRVCIAKCHTFSVGSMSRSRSQFGCTANPFTWFAGINLSVHSQMPDLGPVRVERRLVA